jgi:hypothetical protein
MNAFVNAIPAEPALQRAQGGTGHYRGRWRWWYASIADYRLANPGCSNRDVALHLGKAENTISAIANTDLYREYEAQRKQAWRARNEDILREKLTGVTIRALDAADAQLKKRGDQIPLAIARDLIETGLDRLGFGPQQGPAVVVNNTNQLAGPGGSVTITLLEEARSTLRAVEQRKLVAALPSTEVPHEIESLLDDGVIIDVASEEAPGEASSLAAEGEGEEAAGATGADS